ncbi:alpha/beta hydrolase [Sphingomonas abietis]|uniref:Alpha/beta hydrolase n=1 Tax=Sphingomonas abietis TaxID=3012344 RepID=A0ABY7NHC7_9SPHN|nr:alpha/beta hydrolase [Sphingomonas abietis]WBO20733.1 alpha/beta hydrolase [Sphingomonas abietis]
MNRRTLMIAAGGLLAMPQIALAKRGHAGRTGENAGPGDSGSDEIVSLWPGRPPGGGGPHGNIAIGAKGAISNIAMPVLEVYRPARPTGAAMLVAAGGGYKRIEVDTESRPAARWLAARGVTAFVLRYRLPGEGWHDGPLAPLQDAQRALRVIQAGAPRYGIAPGRIGVLGFSSGGHLMGMTAARSAFQSYRPMDSYDGLSARPMAAALIYPIVTLEPPYDHTSSRIELVGKHPSPAASADWSVESHIRSGCPPMFLVQAQDDPISNIANTAILEDADRRAGVPVERHVLSSGGHGFGMGQPGTPTGLWPSWYESWLSRNLA